MLDINGMEQWKCDECSLANPLNVIVCQICYAVNRDIGNCDVKPPKKKVTFAAKIMIKEQNEEEVTLADTAFGPKPKPKRRRKSKKRARSTDDDDVVDEPKLKKQRNN